MATAAITNLKRSDLIERAYRKIGLGMNQSISGEQMHDGVVALNLVLRQLDLEGLAQSTHLWALTTRTMPLVANQSRYISPQTYPGGQLADDIVELVSVVYRDRGGDDTPLQLMTATDYQTIADKNYVGVPEMVYLKQHKDLETQELYVWPVVGSVGTTNEVVGTNGQNYICTMGHTASAQNRPTSGADWKVYWDNQGSAGATWVSGTAYTSGEQLQYTYRRPLANFTNATDDPDMPEGWSRYLIFRLAYDLASDYAVSLDERQFLKMEYEMSFAALFPSQRPRTTTHHNKATYF